MKLLFVNLLFINLTGSFYSIYNDDDLIGHIYKYENNYKSFKEAVLYFPKIIKKAIANDRQMFLFLPKILDDFCLHEYEKSFKEAARIAITWCDVYEHRNGLKKESYFVIKEDDLNFDTIKNHFVNRPNLTLKREFAQNKTQPDLIKVNFDNLNLNSKRFLLSGGAGFIGCNLARRLLSEGHQVLVLDNLLCGYEKNIEDLKNNKNFAFIKHDVSKPFHINCKFDYVLHLASIPSPYFYYKSPKKTLKSGLHATLNMLKIAKQNNAIFLFTSTSEIYGDPEISPQPENYKGNVSCVGMRAPYDESKRGSEVLVNHYLEKYNLNVCVARIFNTYGPYMNLNDGRVITNFFKAFLENEKITVYGDGNQTRSFCYIDDTIDGLIKLIFHKFETKNYLDRVFNIGNNSEITIKNLVSEYYKLFKHTKFETVYISNIDKHDPKKRCPNLEKVNKELNYFPTVNLEHGLDRTLKYFMQTCF